MTTHGGEGNSPRHGGERPRCSPSPLAWLQDWQGHTALALTSKAGHYHCALLLLEGKANPNARDMEQCTPLMAAAAGGHLSVIQILIERKCVALGHTGLLICFFDIDG